MTGARTCGVTPHVAQNLHARKSTSAIDGRTTRHAGYAISQLKRKLVEEGFGWGKVIGGLRKLHHRGTKKVAWIFTFVAVAQSSGSGEQTGFDIVNLEGSSPVASSR